MCSWFWVTQLPAHANTTADLINGISNLANPFLVNLKSLY